MNSASPLSIVPHGKLLSLDGLRGLAALWVVLHHLTTNELLPKTMIFLHGSMLVETFFVLSGFVICYQYHDRIHNTGDLIKFMIRRFARIWPLHAAILVFMIAPRLVMLALHGPAASELFNGANDHSLSSWLVSLALLQSIGLYKEAVWNGPAWSLSVEFYTYLIFAVVMLAARRHITFAATIICIISTVFLLNSEMRPERFLITCIYCFFIGIIAFRVFKRLSLFFLRYVSDNICTFIQFICVFFLVALIYRGENPGVAFAILNGIFVIILSQQRGAISQILSTRIFQILGAWSLGIYLIHIPLLNVLWRFGLFSPISVLKFDPQHWTRVDTMGFFLLLLPISAASYHWLEVPARDGIMSIKLPKHRRRQTGNSNEVI